MKQLPYRIRVFILVRYRADAVGLCLHTRRRLESIAAARLLRLMLGVCKEDIGHVHARPVAHRSWLGFT